MGNKLILVESPSKAKTIAKYQGPGWVQADQGPVLRQGGEEPEGVVGAGRVLQPDELGRLQAGLQALLPGQDHLLNRGTAH